MAIGLLDILKHSAKFNIVDLITKPVAMFVPIIVAAILLPEEYGIYGFLGLWLMYAGLIGPGFISASSREIPVLIGKDKKKEALQVQNISITAEIVYLIIPTGILFLVAFFFSNTTLKFGFIIIAISYFITKIVSFWAQINTVIQNFNAVATARLLSGIIIPITTVVCLPFLRVYALLIAPIIGGSIVGLYYIKKAPIGFHISIDKREIIRLFKIGVILQGLTLVFWAFRIADRTVIASTLSFEELGYYTFAMTVILAGLNFFADFGRVLQPIIWKHAGSKSNIYEGFKDLERIFVYLALATGIAIPLSQIAFYLLVNVIATKYSTSILIFFVLSLNLYLASIGIGPSLLLNSSIVNKQKNVFLIYLIGLVLNIIFDFLAIALGYGVTGVAIVTICTQGLATAILYIFMKKYIFKNNNDFHQFISLALIPFFSAIIITIIHFYLLSIRLNIVLFILISLILQIMLWSILVKIFYQKYITVKQIIWATKELIKYSKKTLKKHSLNNTCNGKN